MMPKRVLIAPLHWGLGHASRCVPLIRAQLNLGNEVIIAATGGPKALLQQYFPDCEYVEIPFMKITYPADGNMVRHFARNSLPLINSIYREHRWLQHFVRKEKIDLVISDSRFGLWTRKAECVFVSHQVEIKSPVFQGLINTLNRWVMNRYDEVWIPDTKEKPGLAGKLSHPRNMPKRYRYIGALSRFERPKVKTLEKAWDAVAIVSGPEPQRSLFEADIVRQFVESGEALLLLRGRPHEPENKKIGNIRIVNHLNDEDLCDALSKTKRVIARSGYSTIMDLHVLGMQAELHPTPGQTEQEYLAGLHHTQSRKG